MCNVFVFLPPPSPLLFLTLWLLCAADFSSPSMTVSSFVPYGKVALRTLLLLPLDGIGKVKCEVKLYLAASCLLNGVVLSSLS